MCNSSRRVNHGTQRISSSCVSFDFITTFGGTSRHFILCIAVFALSSNRKYAICSWFFFFRFSFLHSGRIHFWFYCLYFNRQSVLLHSFGWHWNLCSGIFFLQSQIVEKKKKNFRNQFDSHADDNSIFSQLARLTLDTVQTPILTHIWFLFRLLFAVDTEFTHFTENFFLEKIHTKWPTIVWMS